MVSEGQARHGAGRSGRTLETRPDGLARHLDDDDRVLERQDLEQVPEGDDAGPVPAVAPDRAAAVEDDVDLAALGLERVGVRMEEDVGHPVADGALLRAHELGPAVPLGDREARRLVERLANVLEQAVDERLDAVVRRRVGRDLQTAAADGLDEHLAGGRRRVRGVGDERERERRQVAEIGLQREARGGRGQVSRAGEAGGQ